MKFIIKIKNIEFEADNQVEAESIAIDIVNDINGDEGFKLDTL